MPNEKILSRNRTSCALGSVRMGKRSIAQNNVSAVACWYNILTEPVSLEHHAVLDLGGPQGSFTHKIEPLDAHRRASGASPRRLMSKETPGCGTKDYRQSFGSSWALD